MGYVALFTGQGSQFAGMGQELYEGSAAAKAVLDEADSVLPGLRSLCFEGPDEELVKTENTQPCVLAVDIAAYRAYGVEPTAAAGHSLGEYAALVAAGSLPLATALPLVRERARAMQHAVPEGKGGMVALLRMTREEAEAARAEVSSGVCDLANLNAPGQYVMSGEVAAMEELVERFGRRQARRLPVSVPFHSSLLREAAEDFGRRLDDVDFQAPAFPVVCNVDAEPLTEPDAIRSALRRQFAGSVLWQTSVEVLLERGDRDFVEFGPKATLCKMVEQIAKEREVEVATRAITNAGDLAGG